MLSITSRLSGLAGFLLVVLLSCHTAEKPKEKDIVPVPEKMEVRIQKNLRQLLPYILSGKGRMSDTIVLALDTQVNALYEKNNFQAFWSRQERWSALGDSLFRFIANAKEYGLFPSDYHYRALSSARERLMADSASRQDAALWSRTDVMLTDALLLIGHDLKRGRLPYDSVTLRSDSILPRNFYTKLFDTIQQSHDLGNVLHSLEPKYPAYDSLKEALRYFLDSVKTFKRYTYLNYPYTDSVAFFKAMQRRFFESDLLPSATTSMDTIQWRHAIADYQKKLGQKATGRLSEALVNKLNYTDWEKFKQIAITLDRYKILPDTLPKTHVWVNIPSFNLQLYSNDTLTLESRVIVGAVKTRTPLLSSAISNFITYPQWTVPYSIIFKEMLPAIQKNVDYLKKENLMVVDRNDSVLNPKIINWKKFNKNYFPYQIKQRQGDDNSLGVLKFNFPNKYSVYLHDTNARWLFGKSNRALSHGCVRVKEWQKLSEFLIRNDTLKYHPDTLRAWIKRQEKHTVYGFKKVPIYIRYFTCAVKNGKIKFYDDIYGEDKFLRERYFADKAIQ